MIAEPLSFTGTLSLQDTLDLHRYHFRYLLRWPIRILMAALSSLIAAIIILVGIKTQFKASFFCILALCAYYPFGWYLHRHLAVSRRYRRHPELFLETTVTFTNESVSTSNFRMDLRLNWDQLAAIIFTPLGLLILARPHTAWFWLPQRLFDGNTQKETIQELAEENKIPIRRMR